MNPKCYLFQVMNTIDDTVFVISFLFMIIFITAIDLIDCSLLIRIVDC